MNKSLIEEWLTALRSGNYPQTRDRLRSHEGGEISYCCLGVLCDIYPEGFWEGTCYKLNGTKLGEYLPQKIADEIDPKCCSDVKVNYKGKKVNISVLNDSLDLNFSELADLIEKTYLV